MSDVEHAFTSRDYLGEGPIWSVREQALYWLNIPSGTIHRWQPATNEHRSFSLGFSIGCLALRARSGLVLATKRGFATWSVEDGLSIITNPLADKPNMRFNDGKVDRQGRFWAGTMVDQGPRTPDGCLYRLDPDGSVHTMLTGLRVPNGLGWSLDNKTMYFTDTPDHTIYAFDFDAVSGSIANRRPFAVIPEADGKPDGLTVDSEGFIWGAHWMGSRLTRYDPSGRIDRVVRVPVQRPTSCAFGGANLDELYITSAALDISDEERKQQPDAGDVFRVRPGVRGLPEPEFGG